MSQDRALLRATELERPVSPEHLQRAEDPELHGRHRTPGLRAVKGRRVQALALQPRRPDPPAPPCGGRRAPRAGPTGPNPGRSGRRAHPTAIGPAVIATRTSSGVIRTASCRSSASRRWIPGGIAPLPRSVPYTTVPPAVPEPHEVVARGPELGRHVAEREDVQRRHDPHRPGGRREQQIRQPLGPRRVRELVDPRTHGTLRLSPTLDVCRHRQVSQRGRPRRSRRARRPRASVPPRRSARP